MSVVNGNSYLYADFNHGKVLLSCNSSVLPWTVRFCGER